MAAPEAGAQGGSPAGGTRLACKYCAFTLRAMVSFQVIMSWEVAGPLCSQKTPFKREGESREKRVDGARWIEDVGLVSRDEAVELGEHYVTNGWRRILVSSGGWELMAPQTAGGRPDSQCT